MIVSKETTAVALAVIKKAKQLETKSKRQHEIRRSAKRVQVVSLGD